MRPTRRDPERGFALVAVVLVLTLLGVVSAEFAYSMRLEASSVRSWKDTIVAGHLAEAAVEQAIREIVADYSYVVVADDGQLTFFTTQTRVATTPTPVALPRLPRTGVPLGVGQFSYRITDEQARFNVNNTPPDRMDRLLAGMGITKLDRDVIVDSIQDWLDANEEHRANGAESEDYYLKLPTPYRSHNAPMESVTELLQVRGVTPRIFTGVPGTPGLVQFVTVKGPGQLNLNTASPQVLLALGLSEADVLNVVQGRRDRPYANVPPQYTGRGMVTNSLTLRIDAEGIIEGQVRARLTVIVQKRAEAGTGGIDVLEWSGIR